MIKYDANLHL